ncbi:MAG: hypothetical protein SGJ20_04480 [Planctomycetota bacterium]|nr:hypothetical protein [Planctomycetota bacterium]
MLKRASFILVLLGVGALSWIGISNAADSAKVASTTGKSAVQATKVATGSQPERSLLTELECNCRLFPMWDEGPDDTVYMVERHTDPCNDYYWELKIFAPDAVWPQYCEGPNCEGCRDGESLLFNSLSALESTVPSSFIPQFRPGLEVVRENYVRVQNTKRETVLYVKVFTVLANPEKMKASSPAQAEKLKEMPMRLLAIGYQMQEPPANVRLIDIQMDKSVRAIEGEKFQVKMRVGGVPFLVRLANAIKK